MFARTRFSNWASRLTAGIGGIGGRRDLGRQARVIRGLLLAAALILTPVGSVAYADALDDARSSGAVGERFDGYLAIRDPAAPASVRQLVEDVNAKRRKVYSDVSTREGTTLDAVGRIYAREIVKNVPPGTWILREDGQWVRK